MSEPGTAIPTCEGPSPDPGRPSLAIPKGSCDCHAHIFGPPEKYPFTSNRSYTPPEAGVAAYRRMLAALGLERAVIVQPSVYGKDNRCTRDAVASAGGAWRGVAVVEPEISSATLAALHDGGFRGVRINLLFKGGLALDALERIAALIAPRGWHVQLLLDGRDLPELAPRLRRLPVHFVIDHLGHMPVALGIEHPGFQTILQLLREGHCWVKMSGAYRISSEPHPHEDVIPIACALAEAAPHRLVFGTDWPHPAISGPMPRDADLLDLLPRWVPDANLRRRILVENPAKLYDFSAVSD